MEETLKDLTAVFSRSQASSATLSLPPPRSGPDGRSRLRMPALSAGAPVALANVLAKVAKTPADAQEKARQSAASLRELRPPVFAT